MSQVTDNPDLKPNRAELVISKGWVQGVALVFVFGFFVMGFLAYRTYTDSMPLPQQVVADSGEEIFTDADVTAGQEIFLARGLQQYGSIVGHGAYLGPDYTAEYLRLASEHVKAELADNGVQDPTQATIDMMRENRYDEATGILVYTPEQASAFLEIRDYYADYFGTPTTEFGLLPSVITDPDEIHELTAFFSGTAWAASTERPNQDYTYTNNWPPEPRVDNKPTADILVWSAMSLIALLAGLGALFAVYGRWSRKIGWKSSEVPALSFRPGPAARRLRDRPAGPPRPEPAPRAAQRRVRLPRGPRRLALSGGPVAVAQVVRPGQPRHAVPGQPVGVQRVPRQGHLHVVERRTRDATVRGQLAGLRVGPLPPRDRVLGDGAGRRLAGGDGVHRRRRRPAAGPGHGRGDRRRCVAVVVAPASDPRRPARRRRPHA